MPRGLVLQPTYRVRRGVPVVQLYGRLEDGPPFLVEEDRYRPAFFVLDDHRELLDDEPDATCERTALRDLRGRRVARVTLPIPARVPVVRDRLRARGAATFEADVRFPYRFLTELGVRAGVEVRGDAQVTPAGLRLFRNPELRAADDVRVEPTALSIDLETTPDASRVLSAALVTDRGDARALLAREPGARDARDVGARVFASERALLEALVATMRELDPDVVVGWNVVGFDLRVLAERCEANGVACELGRAPGAIAFRSDASFGRDARAEIPGRMVLDGIPLVRDAIALDDYRLETVARHVLGRGKRIAHAGEGRVEEIQRLHREDPAALVAYNVEDARLVLDILAAEGLLALAVERSQLSGMQLDRVGASIASFDLLYLPALRAAGRVAPTVERDREPADVRGGAVLDGVPGLFRNVALLDFKSLYPSLMRTFQLDPLAHALAGEARAGPRARSDDAIVAPNGARFARSGAILPGLLASLAERRERAKARGDRHADQAIKLMMNSMFGVLGSTGCRFFDPDVANAITGFGQQTLAWTREAIEARGLRVLYGDTDSVFVALGDAVGDAASAQRAAERLRADVSAAIDARIRADYGVDSALVLELECVYARFLLPHVRGGAGGSKKRYAGWLDGELDLVGLESVRRDWPPVARRLQRGLLERVFRDEDPLPFAREVAEAMQAGRLDAELVYAKRVRKASLDAYTASAPPHVQAARKAAERGARPGGSIRYVVTRDGPEPVDPDAPLPDALRAAIDRAHYLDKVLRPIADGVLREVGASFGDALGEAKQLDLL